MKGSAFHGGNVRQKKQLNVGKIVLTNLVANTADQKHQGTENKFRYQFNFIVPSNCINKNVIAIKNNYLMSSMPELCAVARDSLKIEQNLKLLLYT